MGRKIQGPPNRKVKYTCSPGHIRKYLKNLSPQQKDYVRKIGFGSFLSMADFELDGNLTLWLIQRFNCKTECLEFEGGISIPVRPLVKSVLGIPSGPIQVVERSYFDPAVYHRYYVGNIDSSGGKGREGFFEKGSKFMHTAGEQICSETEEKQFCIAFMMGIIALYLAPNKNSLTCKPFFGAVQQVDKLSQMDWCNFTASYLFEGIKEFKQTDWLHINIKGCVHILSVIFIDLVKNAGLKIPGGFPRISVVTTLHKELVNSCSPQVLRLEESVYASVVDKTPKDNIIKRRKCADSDTNTNAGPDQFGTTVENTTCNTTELMETHHYSTTRFHKEGVYSRGMRKQPEDPLVSTELGTALSSPNTLSLDIVERPEVDTSAPSAAPSSVTESVSHEDTHTRQESLIITGNADSTHHHSVEQEQINFPRDGQQFLFNEPSSEPYAAQIDEGVQVAPDVLLGRNRASPSMIQEGGRSAKEGKGGATQWPCGASWSRRCCGHEFT